MTLLTHKAAGLKHGMWRTLLDVVWRMEGHHFSEDRAATLAWRCTTLGEVAGAASMSMNPRLKVILGQIATPSFLCVACKANALFKHTPPLANRKRNKIMLLGAGSGKVLWPDRTELL